MSAGRLDNVRTDFPAAAALAKGMPLFVRSHATSVADERSCR